MYVCMYVGIAAGCVAVGLVVAVLGLVCLWVRAGLANRLHGAGTVRGTQGQRSRPMRAGRLGMGAVAVGHPGVWHNSRRRCGGSGSMQPGQAVGPDPPSWIAPRQMGHPSSASVAGGCCAEARWRYGGVP